MIYKTEHRIYELCPTGLKLYDSSPSASGGRGEGVKMTLPKELDSSPSGVTLFRGRQSEYFSRQRHYDTLNISLNEPRRTLRGHSI